jgi:hypothetical protein
VLLIWFCSAPDEESESASWDVSSQASQNQTLKQVKFTDSQAVICIVQQLQWAFVSPPPPPHLQICQFPESRFTDDAGKQL